MVFITFRIVNTNNKCDDWNRYYLLFCVKSNNIKSTFFSNFVAYILCYLHVHKFWYEGMMMIILR
jgi:hypothetical protein